MIVDDSSALVYSFPRLMGVIMTASPLSRLPQALKISVNIKIFSRCKTDSVLETFINTYDIAPQCWRVLSTGEDTIVSATCCEFLR